MNNNITQMSYIGREYFDCTHKNLTKNKFSNSTYTCDKCNRDFVMIKANHDPIYPKLPNHPGHPDFPEEFPRPLPHFPRKDRRFPKYL